MKGLTRCALLLCCAFGAAAASAEVTQADLQVAARALSFTRNPPSGTLRLGIVHSAASPRSARQAEAVRELLGDGLRVGNIEFRPMVITLGDAATSEVDFFFLTEHVGARTAMLGKISAERQIPCLTVDIDSVREGSCGLGVRSSPKVEILVNRDAADASGMRFATVFRVMVSEL